MMKRCFGRSRRGEDPLNSIKEEPIQRADPMPSDRQPTAQPDTTAPLRGRCGAFVRGIWAILCVICPCLSCTEKEDDESGPSDATCPGIKETNSSASAKKPSSSMSSAVANEFCPPASAISGGQPASLAHSNRANESCPLASAIGGCGPASSSSSKSVKRSCPPSSVVVDKQPSASALSDRANKPIPSASVHGGSKPASLAQSAQSPSSSCRLTLECFSLHRVLGQGGFGKVMLASHHDSGQQVAIKVVKKISLLCGDLYSIRTEREVLEDNVYSPFLTHLLGSFQTEEYLLYVLEYLSGGDLQRLIRAQAPFPGLTISILTAEIICGLSNLHDRGIMHRDLKPDNILLDSAGHCKISDFGLSVTDMFFPGTTTGCAGTVHYMAPEVLFGLSYDIMADYFSLGLIIYEMATGKHPYYRRGMQAEHVQYIRMHSKTHYPEDIDPELKDLIEKHMAINPEKRAWHMCSIRQHPFFSAIDWAYLEIGGQYVMAHSRPCPETPLDQRFFLDEVMSPVRQPAIPSQYQRLFDNFSYRSERLRSKPSSPQAAAGYSFNMVENTSATSPGAVVLPHSLDVDKRPPPVCRQVQSTQW